MPEVTTYPAAVLAGLWLNSAQAGYVSETDAANALETVFDQVEGPVVFSTSGTSPDQATVSSSEQQDLDQITSWSAVVRFLKASRIPAAIALPIQGDPAGVPISSLPGIRAELGVVSLNPNTLLFCDSQGLWTLRLLANAVIHYDTNQTRRLLSESIAQATKELAAGELAGNEQAVAQALSAFSSLDLPPHLSKRSVESLELASKIIIVASSATTHATALHSPSVDRRRIEILNGLVSDGRRVLQSVVID